MFVFGQFSFVDLLIVEGGPLSATLFNVLRLAEKSLLNQSGAQPPKIVSCVALAHPFSRPSASHK